jgi:hypothetical protein
MLEPPKNPTNWDNFRKGAMLVLILWAAASAVLCIIYFFILGGRSPAPANIFRALILLVPFPKAPAVKREADGVRRWQSSIIPAKSSIVGNEERQCPTRGYFPRAQEHITSAT